jgi:Tol biopolymer transport system component
MDSDGGNVRQLTHEKAPIVAGMQSWTADSQWIYFGLFGKKAPLMCRIAPDGSKFKVIGEGIDPALSPDGKTVVFAGQISKGHCLFAMDADGTNLRQLTKNENQKAYSERRADKRPVWVMGIDGSNPHVIEALLYQVTIDGSRDSRGTIWDRWQLKNKSPRGEAVTHLKGLSRGKTHPLASPSSFSGDNRETLFRR